MDGTKQSGVTSKPEAMMWIWRIYGEANGSNLVIEDRTIYKNTELGLDNE